jgi:hypothetical protein
MNNNKKYFGYGWYVARFFVGLIIIAVVYEISPGFLKEIASIIESVIGHHVGLIYFIAYFVPPVIFLYIKILYDLVLQEEFVEAKHKLR